MSKSRLAYIAIDRSIGILLVVHGHTLAEANYHVQKSPVLLYWQGGEV